MKYAFLFFVWKTYSSKKVVLSLEGSGFWLGRKRRGCQLVSFSKTETGSILDADAVPRLPLSDTREEDIGSRTIE